MFESTRNTTLLFKFAEPLSLAIILEASGYPKPGNIHRFRDKQYMRYEAFLATGVLSYKYFLKGLKRGFRGAFKEVVIGDLVYGLVSDVIDWVKSSNTCLGSALLLNLMSVSIGFLLSKSGGNLQQLSSCAKEVASRTTVLDTVYYYMAIRKARPSYLKPDDNTEPFVNVWDPFFKEKLMLKGHRLVDVLLYSSKFDIVAKEAISGFEQGILAEQFLRKRFEEHRNLNRAIVETYLYLLANNVDTVVMLKHGHAIATSISSRAADVLKEVISADNDKWISVVRHFDEELQAANINPGSVADLTAEVIALYMVRNILEKSELLDLSY